MLQVNAAVMHIYSCNTVSYELLFIWDCLTKLVSVGQKAFSAHTPFGEKME